MTRYRAASDMLRIAAARQGDGFGYAPWSRSAHLLDAMDWGILQQTMLPATLEEHATRIATRASRPLPDLQSRLTRLRELGVLVPATDFEAVRKTDAVGATITKIAIPTRKRPTKLRACIDSWLAMMERHGRALELVVADDGRDDEERSSTRTVIDELAGRGVHVAYAEATACKPYATALAKESGVDPELLVWALSANHPEITGEGAARNLLLLDGVGTGVIFTDDDTLCRFSRAPNFQAGIELTTRSPMRSWFPNGDAATEHDIDPCTMFEEALGQDIASWTSSTATSFDAAASTTCRHLRDHGGRIATVQPGIAGDIATGSVAHFLTFAGDDRARLHQSKKLYERAIRTRQGIVAPERWSIANIDHCMTYQLAVDARSMLPPFMPTGRNCDGLFGIVLRHVARDAYKAFAPWVVKHDANPRPSSRQHMIDTATLVYQNGLVARLIVAAGLEPPSSSMADNLRAVGRLLMHAAAQEPRDFVEHVWIHIARTRANDLALLRQCIAAFHGSPSWWAADTSAVADNIRHSLTRPSLAHPHDLTRVLGADRAMVELQTATRRFGELLVAWPDIRAAAERLGQRGVRAAVRGESV